MSQENPGGFVDETEAERLAKKHIEAYMNECQCQTRADACQAMQKLLGMTLAATQAIHSGQTETVQ